MGANENTGKFAVYMLYILYIYVYVEQSAVINKIGVFSPLLFSCCFYYLRFSIWKGFLRVGLSAYSKMIIFHNLNIAF